VRPSDAAAPTADARRSGRRPCASIAYLLLDDVERDFRSRLPEIFE
jgi:hypothetical protein